jgi:2-isopropylmalate synthase
MDPKSPFIEIYDTTLRDGSQAEDVSFSVEDKVRITLKLDELGVHFIEGGWPGANPKDIEFFQTIKATPLQQAKIVAFGSTRKAKNSAKDDPVALGGNGHCDYIWEKLDTSCHRSFGDNVRNQFGIN